MSFTNYYFELGYNTAIEKVAARKKDDEGMGTAAKLGLGALGAGALGAGAYYSPEILEALGQDGASQWAGQNIQAPMQEAGKYLAGKAGEAGDYMKDKYQDIMAPEQAPTINDLQMGVGSEVGKGTSHAANVDDVKKAIEEMRTGGGIGTEIGKVWDSAKDSAGETWDAATNAAHHTFKDNAINPLAARIREAKEVLGNAGSAVGSHVDDTAQLFNGSQPGSLLDMGRLGIKDLFGTK